MYAKSKYVGNTPRKTRLVAGLLKHKKALEAAEMLKFVDRAAALPVRKTLESAIANATFNKGWDKKLLVIEKVMVDEAPSFKRGRAVSRGRYRKILKRNSHITIALGLMEPRTGVKEETKKKEVKEEVKTEVKKETKLVKNKK